MGGRSSGPPPRPVWAPAGLDLDRPNAARVYDYYLGGAHNFAADRAMAREAIADWPDLPLIMQANRAFLRRAVRFVVRSGISQLLDLGSGIPTVGNVHEVAEAENQDARVVYVDRDPVAVTHGQALLSGNANATIIQSDLRDPGSTLALATATGLIDLSEPIAVLLVAVLHFVPDTDDPASIIDRYRQAMAPGSCLVICHASPDQQPRRAATHQELYSRTSTPMTMRSREAVAALLAGFGLVEPGLVLMAQWRPEDESGLPRNAQRFPGYAAVASRL